MYNFLKGRWYKLISKKRTRYAQKHEAKLHQHVNIKAIHLENSVVTEEKETLKVIFHD